MTKSSRHSALRLGASFAAAALLAGCSMIPELRLPAAPVPERFANIPDSGIAPPPWREYYADPALHALIEAALEHNRDMRIALARIEEARALAGIARADRFPTLDAQATANRNRTPADLSPTGRARTSSRYDAGLGITSFELDFWGRVAALNEAALAQYLASEEAAKSFRVSLISDVAGTWYQLAELNERERLANETLKSRVDSLDLIRKRRDAGLATDLEALAAESLAESVRGQWAELKRQRMQTENALRLLTGMAAPLPATSALAGQPKMIALSPGLPSEVLLKRPDVRAAEQRLVAANASIGAARAAFYPRISLTGSFGTASSDLSGLFDSGSGAWLFNPVLKWPLFDAGRTQANLDLAEARKVAAVAEYEKTIQQAFREVADALAAQATYGEQLAAQQTNLQAQQARLERVKARAQTGIASYLEVLDASREAFAAEQALATTQRQALASQVALFRALGGGE